MKNDSWISFELMVPAAAVDLICDQLTPLGCTGTLVEQRDLDTFTVPDEEPDPGSDLKIQAFFPATADPIALRDAIEKCFVPLRSLFAGRSFLLGEMGQIDQQDWAEDWKQHFSTLRIGRRLLIKPSWEEILPQAEDVVLELDPGMAFGTGTHGTTFLCLGAIAELFETASPPRSLLDVGTGSGILAMAAAALGAQEILACDIDPMACEVARENCRRNGLEERIRITDAPLEELQGRYDVVVANILAEENLRLAPALLERLAPGGHLFLSGILREKAAMVEAGFSRLPLTLLRTTSKEEWVCLIWRNE